MESTADNYHEVQRVFLSKFVKPDLRNILYWYQAPELLGVEALFWKSAW
jgi:hypothetical protein